MLPRSFSKVLWIIISFFCSKMFMKRFTHILFFQVNSREHYMAGWFIPELHYPFAEICIDCFNSIRVQESIQVTFLGEHRFALHYFLCTLLPDDVEYNAIVLITISGPVNRNAVGDSLHFKFNQVIIQIG